MLLFWSHRPVKYSRVFFCLKKIIKQSFLYHFIYNKILLFGGVGLKVTDINMSTI